MPRGRWKSSEEQLANEAYAVLIEKQKPGRVYTERYLLGSLSDPTVAKEFLQTCLDFDDTKDLKEFRKGLLLVVRSLGPERISRDMGVNRVSLYRMLSPNGNPTLKTLQKLFKELGVRLWIVDEEFIQRRSTVIRPKDQKKYGREG